MQRIRTVIIGMGRMGKTRYKAMERHGGYEIVALADINIEQTAVDFTDHKLYSDWKECIDAEKPGAVFVCVVNSITPEVVCYALSKGIHVFSEKPPGRSLNDTLLMQESSIEHQECVLKFGFNHRYHNSVIEAKSLVDSKILGDIVCARAVYGKAGNLSKNEWRNNVDLSGGGILIDQGIHALDLLLYFLGDFVDVQCSVDHLIWNDVLAEDSVFAILKTSDGKIASLHSNAIQWKHKFDLDIICTHGYIALNGLLTSTQSYGEEQITYYKRDFENKTEKIGNPKEHTLCFDSDDSWYIEICEFYDAIATGSRIENGSIDEAVKVMKLVTQIYENR